MKKLFLVLVLSLCLVGCDDKETRDYHLKTQRVEEDKNGNVHTIMGDYISYRYIDGEYIVDGTNLTKEEFLDILDKMFEE